MDTRVLPESTPARSRVEPGIVVFAHSMQLKYANEQARQLLNTRNDQSVAALQKDDLRVEIVKLGARIREQDLTRWDGQSQFLLETRKTVRTIQGSFRLLAFGMLDHYRTKPQQIMIVIEDRQSEQRVRQRRREVNTA